MRIQRAHAITYRRSILVADLLAECALFRHAARNAVLAARVKRANKIEVKRGA